MSANATSAAVFRRLHQGPGVLLLANCWDAGSARHIESLGAKALATTSAGLAWSNGYPDGDIMPLDRLVAAVSAIARVRDAAGVADSVAAVIDAGGVGCNIEDARGTVDALCAKIENAKRGASRRGTDFWINARTDVFLRGLVERGRRVDETISRAKRYRDAGADSLFVPGLADADEIRAVAAAIQYPLSVMAWPGLPPAAELAKLGVRRLSAGAAITEAAWGRVAALAKMFLAEGRSDPLAEGAMDFAAINSLFTARKS